MDSAEEVKRTEELVRCARELREKFQKDPHRPRYHFVTPEGICMPFDPNGAIYWRGKYHLFYIFQKSQEVEPRLAHCWGHASSLDLVHWAFHPTALEPATGDPDQGIFSGNAFVNKEGVPTILYHGVRAGNCIATAQDDDLIHWSKSPANPIVPIPKKGEPGFGKYSSWDPHGWLEGQTYYAVFGGSVPTLFKARDLAHWEFLHPFIESDRGWTDADEDCSCPDFFPLGNEYMLLFISHRRGAQYYLGRWEKERFHPERHGRMNWPGGGFFAPESLLDARGRRIFWAWVLDARPDAMRRASGWSGVMSLPRVLSLDAAGTLRIEPVEELNRLRLNHRQRKDLNLGDGTELALEGVRGDCLELAIEMAPQDAKELGVKVRCSPDGVEQTVILCDLKSNALKIDVSRSSSNKEIVYRPWCIHKPKDAAEAQQKVTVQEAPFELRPGELLELRIFLDRSILEVFANGRQCVTQCIYPSRSDSLGVLLFSRGGSLKVRSLNAWDMAPANSC
jgi:sucrose-6-phosphate hydrolase SacC (GH32 family)